MDNLRQVYRCIDDWVLSLSRGKYAVLIGVLSALGVLAVGTVFENLDYAFAVGISVTLAVLNYISNPNQKEG